MAPFGAVFRKGGRVVKLSQRLKASADFVTCHSRVADVGCDHAYTSIYLVQKEIAAYCIAMDVKEGPLKRAKENIAQYGCTDRIQTRLSDGLAGLLPGEVDTVLISGMGGLLVKKILEDAQERGFLAGIEELILQPQSDLKSVRKFLHHAMFQIKEETMLREDGKFYVSIHAVKNHGKEPEPYKEEIEYLFGKALLDKKDPCLLKYLQDRKEKYQEILAKMEQYGKKRKIGLIKKSWENFLILTELWNGIKAERNGKWDEMFRSNKVA